MERLYKKGLAQTIKYLAFVFIFIIFIYYSRTNQMFSIQNLLNYSPENVLAAILFFLFLYTIKSCILILPLPILQIVVGIAFNPLLAFSINFLGLIITSTVAYGIGLALGKNRVESFLNQFKKGEELTKQGHYNEGIFVFTIRSIGLVAIDLAGMFFGSVQTPFMRYLVFSTLGLIPSMCITTFIGLTAEDPTSPSFVLSLIVKVILVAVSLNFYKRKYSSNPE